MKVIIDSNILLSALIKDSKTREILVKFDWKFYYPEMSFHEIRKYKDLVLKKSSLDDNKYNLLINHLLKYIHFIPDEKIIEYLEEAKEIMMHIDPDDVVFIASALSITGSIIWSDDTHFEKQKKIKVLKTKSIVNLFNNF
jgi:predicted nucleic acid-binding protein